MNSPTIPTELNDRPPAVAPVVHAFMVVLGSIAVTVAGLLYLQPPATSSVPPAAVTDETASPVPPASAGNPLEVTLETLPVALLDAPTSLFEEPYNPQTQSIAAQVRSAEVLLEEHLPGEAAVQLDRLITQAERAAQATLLPPRAYLLLGLAHEVLGDTTRSQAAYQEAFRRTDRLSQRTCLALRLAHGLVQRQQSPMAASMLMNLLVKYGADMPADVRSEVLASLAWSLSDAETQVAMPLSMLDLNHLEVCLPPLSTQGVLAEWDRHWDEPPALPVLRLQIEIQQRVGSQPQEILGHVRAPVMPVEDLLEALCRETNWTLRFTDEARHLLRGRSGSLNTAVLTLDTLLDAVLLPLDVEWSYDGENLHVVSFREQAGVPERTQPGVQAMPFRRRASRYLQRAVTQASASPQLPLLFTEIARRELQMGHAAASVQALEQVIALSPTGRLATCTWYNLGKLYLLADHPDDALKAMFHAADQLDGDVLTGAAYLFAGRILLESHNVQEAIPQLVRAITLSRGEVQGRAVLLLSMAYLLKEEHASANNVLWESQSSITLPMLNDQAAFLVAFIRYRAAQPAEREFMARQLLTSVTNLQQEQVFGDGWDLLQALTYQELGLIAERDQIIQRNLQLRPKTVSQQVLKSLLTRANPTQLIAQTSDASNEMTGQELLDAEDLERKGRIDEAIALCARRLTNSHVAFHERQQLLGILGRCYQHKGQHAEAIRCFVGLTPEQRPLESDIDASMK